MKIWIDAQDPKSVIFLNKVAEKLRQKGAKILFTTRAFRENLKLLEIWNIRARIIGHYGITLKEKLIASTTRILGLIPIVEEFKPDGAISFSSPECARVAYGLAIPHFCANDSPHTEASPKLTIPLSQCLFTPWVIPKHAWVKYGIDEDRIFQYRALDVVAWLKDFKPRKNVLNELNLSLDKPIIVVRALEIFATYVMGRVKDPTGTIVKNLIRELGNDVQIVVIPRYEAQLEKLKSELQYKNVIITEKPIDATSLLSYADVLICGGGTMAQEAALLGTPVISIFPIPYKMYCLEYLLERRFLFKPKRIEDVPKLTHELLTNNDLKEDYRERAKKELESMENPAEYIASKVIELLHASYDTRKRA